MTCQRGHHLLSVTCAYTRNHRLISGVERASEFLSDLDDWDPTQLSVTADGRFSQTYPDTNRYTNQRGQPQAGRHGQRHNSLISLASRITTHGYGHNLSDS
jgi:hypothetical protein